MVEFGWREAKEKEKRRKEKRGKEIEGGKGKT